jgi:tetratricopeptide (TPR) repeat protein
MEDMTTPIKEREESIGSADENERVIEEDKKEWKIL